MLICQKEKDKEHKTWTFLLRPLFEFRYNADRELIVEVENIFLKGQRRKVHLILPKKFHLSSLSIWIIASLLTIFQSDDFISIAQRKKERKKRPFQRRTKQVMEDKDAGVFASGAWASY